MIAMIKNSMDSMADLKQHVQDFSRDLFSGKSFQDYLKVQQDNQSSPSKEAEKDYQAVSEKKPSRKNEDALSKAKTEDKQDPGAEKTREKKDDLAPLEEKAVKKKAEGLKKEAVSQKADSAVSKAKQDQSKKIEEKKTAETNNKVDKSAEKSAKEALAKQDKIIKKQNLTENDKKLSAESKKELEKEENLDDIDNHQQSIKEKSEQAAERVKEVLADNAESHQKSSKSEDKTHQNNNQSVAALNANKKENTEKDKLDKNNDKSKTRIVVQDLRSKEGLSRTQERQKARFSRKNEGVKAEKAEIKPFSLQNDNQFNGNSRDIEVVLQGNKPSVNQAHENLRGNAFMDRTALKAELAQKMRGQVNNEVVRQANFMLKDQGKGEIRLILRPQSLGNVKIQLFMEERHIAGRIIVENNSIKEIVENNLQDLSRSFKEGGFELGQLDVSVNSQGQQGQSKGQQENPADFFRNIVTLDQSVPQISPDNGADSQINLVV